MTCRRILPLVTMVLLVWHPLADVRQLRAQSSTPLVYVIPIHAWEGVPDPTVRSTHE